MKSIENILSVLGLTVEPDPISLDRVTQLNPKALGLAVEPDTIS